MCRQPDSLDLKGNINVDMKDMKIATITNKRAMICFPRGSSPAGRLAALLAVIALVALGGRAVHAAPPTFGQPSYSFSIAENAQFGAAVGTVTATGTGTIEYSITDSTPSQDFAIDSSTGAITVDASLDYETTTTYTLTVQAAIGAETATVTVTINVTDVGPTFAKSSYSFSVAEDAADDHDVGTVAATGGSGTLSYTLSGDDDSWHFSIDDNGLIEVDGTGNIDYETKTSYSLTVTATDDNSEPASVSVTITVTNVGPTFAKTSYSFSVSEGAAANTAIGTVAATGGSGTLTYELQGDDAGKFEFATATGAITVKANELDYETATSHALTVRVVDNNNEPATVSVTITVTDAGPTFAKSSYSFTVAENAADDHDVGTVAVTGGSGTTSYQLSGDDSDHFSIDANGLIEVDGTSLDYETKASYSLTVTATDGNSEAASVSVTITLTDSGPTFPKAAYVLTIPENSAVNTLVGTVPASGGATPVTYSGSGGGAGNFDFGAAGQITVKSGATLDYEGSAISPFTLTATDADNETATTTVTVNLTDVGPTFAKASYSFSVGEDAADDTDVGTVTATVDSGTLRYRLSGDDNGHFSIDANGLIQVNGTSIDYETRKSYSLTVTADTGDNTEAAMVALTINLTDAGPTPGKTSYTFSVSEDAADDADVGTVTATVSSGTLRYALSGDDSDHFSIDANGLIQVNGTSIDYESKTSYDLTVNIDTGSGTEAIAVPLTINVTDVGPKFGKASYSFSISETAVDDADVGTVTASVASGTLRYQLGGGDNTHFSIDANGLIQVNGTSIDYEAKASYNLTVTADTGANTEAIAVPLTINVINVGPTPGKASYTFSVSEDAADDADVGAITATVASGTLRYTLSGDDNDHFSIDANGLIEVDGASNVDYETKASYSLTVGIDSGDNTELTNVPLTINVIDVGPTPGKASYAFSVSEDAADDADVGTVTATVASGTLRYRLTGDDNGHFSIDDNGLIEVNGTSIDYETKRSYALKLVIDTGAGTEPTTVPLTINVIDVGPAFTQPTYHFRVAEGAPPGTVVGTLAAGLPAGYTELRYSFAPASNVFEVGQRTGEIRVKGDVDYTDALPTYTLTAQVLSARGGDANAPVTDAGNATVTIGPPGSTPPPAGSAPSGGSSASPAPAVTVADHPLGAALTLAAEPVPVGAMVRYTLSLTNRSGAAMTGVTWRDVTLGGAPQPIGELAAGDSVTVAGAFGPVQAMHLPGIILTVAAYSDQTGERLASRFVALTAAPPAPMAPTAEPSTLDIVVERSAHAAPDAHLAHNTPDLRLTLDGAVIACGFLTHYETTGGLTRWGYAVSEVFEEQPGSLTQYYQRGVVDCQQRDGVWRVERRLAWDYFGGGLAGAPDLGVEPDLLSDRPGVELGPWGHRVSNVAVDGTEIGFLDFFEALGGVDAFGYPKTDARYDDDPRAVLGIPGATPGFIRQYFQAAVMEYHPGDPQPVKLRLLGTDLRDRLYPDGGYLDLASFNPAPPLAAGQPYVAERIARR